MSEQLCLFDAVSDNERASLTNSVSDAQIKKQQAIQKYLDRADKEAIACVSKYSPGRRKTEYYRLSYRIDRNRVKHIHIKGGSTIAELANYRAKKLQAMIDRGAELSEVLAAVATFNSGS
jgi:hypothetical protein